MEPAGLPLLARPVVVVVTGPAPLLAVFAAGATFVLGRGLARQHPVAVPAGVVLTALAGGLVGLRSGSLLEAEGAPFGYANATAAAAVVTAAASLLIHLRVSHPALRLAAGLGVLIAAALPLAIGSRAAVVGGAVVAMGLFPAVRDLPRRWLAMVGAAAVTCLLVVTTVTGWFYRPDQPVSTALRGGRWVAAGRLELWHRAVELSRDRPWTGAGPGAFAADAGPTAAPFERYVHAEHLQVAAELGLPALLVALGVAAWLLRDATRHDTVVGIVLLTAVGVHLAVDYVGHFPPVLAGAAAIVGASSARPASPDPEVHP